MSAPRISRPTLEGLSKTDHTYLIGIGSNQRHPIFGQPRAVVGVVMELLDETLGTVTMRAPIIDSAPIGPSQRRYANSALLLETRLNPLSLLGCLQQVEAAFGRIRSGQRWRARVLDLDIVLWSGGHVDAPALTIPHPLFRERDFVLGPADAIAPNWRDPGTALTLRQLNARLGKWARKA